MIIEDKPSKDRKEDSVLANRDLLPPSIFDTVERITFITEEERNINEEEFSKIINYIQEITNLKEVW